MNPSTPCSLNWWTEASTSDAHEPNQAHDLHLAQACCYPCIYTSKLCLGPHYKAVNLPQLFVSHAHARNPPVAKGRLRLGGGEAFNADLRISGVITKT